MDDQMDFLPGRDWLKADGNGQPVLWVREVRLLYRLEPGPQAEIRRVPLQQGVNIVWAKPADADEPNPEARGRGHDVGKTSFCRLIRYLLGEDHYGNEELKLAITTKESLSRAWVLGEVVVAGEPWAVARPLYVGAHHFAIKGISLDDLIVAPAADRQPHKAFVEHLEEKVVGGLAVQTFDDAGQHPIRWLHVLEWLARDQEAHLAGLFKWRDSTSQHGSPELSADEAQFLARCILGVTDVDERRQIERRNALMRDRLAQNENARYFERRIKDAMQRARDELPNGDELPQVGEALFIDVVVSHAKQLVSGKRSGLQTQLAQLGIDELEAALERAIGETALAKSRHDELAALVKETEDALARFTDKAQPSGGKADALDAIIAKLKPDRAYCEVPVNIALFQCPLLQAKRLSGHEAPSANENVAELTKKKREHVAQQLDGLKRNFQQISEQLAACREREQAARARRDERREKRATLREQIATLDDEAAAWRVRAEDAKLSNERLTETRGKLEALEGEIELSKTKQDEAQKNVRARQLEIGEAFMAICRHFKGKRANAELKFTRDEINARIGSGGGAYSALSSLSFDFCALVARLNNIGHHPGFIIHDSPRESDMEPSLYRPLFLLAKQLEGRAGASFQYIITTTEPPPKEMMALPHLRLELDASRLDGKLFKEEL